MMCWRRLRHWQALGVWAKLHPAMLIKLRIRFERSLRTQLTLAAAIICSRFVEDLCWLAIRDESTRRK